MSTLRRRIKKEDIEYKFEDGKYYLLDVPLAPQQKMREPQTQSPSPAAAAPPPQPSGRRDSDSAQKSALTKCQEDDKLVSPPRTEIPTAEATAVGENMTQQLLDEIKRAYALVLQEKEEQMLQVKEEIADLRTLVRVLEEENDRLKKSLEESKSLDQWLRGEDKQSL